MDLDLMGCFRWITKDSRCLDLEKIGWIGWMVKGSRWLDNLDSNIRCWVGWIDKYARLLNSYPKFIWSKKHLNLHWDCICKANITLKLQNLKEFRQDWKLYRYCDLLILILGEWSHMRQTWKVKSVHLSLRLKLKKVFELKKFVQVCKIPINETTRST